MQVANHFFDPSHIVGIGPMYLQPTSDAIEYSLYGSLSYFFEVHLLHRTIRIQSDYFKRTGIDPEELKRNNEKSAAWKSMYKIAKEDIENMIRKRVNKQQRTI